MVKQLIYLFKKLPSNLKFNFYILQILILFHSTIQLLSILSIGPFIAVVSGNLDFLKKFEYLNQFKFSSQMDLLIFTSSLVFLLFLISNILIATVYILQQRLAQKASAFISYKIVEKFYHLPFDYILKNNSSYFRSITEKETASLTGNILMPLSDLNAKFFPLLLTLLALIYINVKAAAIVFIFLSIGYILVFIVTKKKLQQNSKKIVADNMGVSHLLNEILKSYKEAKIFNIENKFLSIYYSIRQKLSLLSANHIILQTVPRQFFEVLALLSIIIVIFYLVLNSNKTETLSTVGIYLAAGYRIMPSLQSILFAISSIKGNQYSLKTIHEILIAKEIPSKNFINHGQIINKLEVKNLNFSYDNIQIFKDTNLEFKKGTITGIYGPSGSGKTTLINILLSFIKPGEKTKFVINNKVSNLSLDFAKKYISFVPQNIFIFNDNIINNITFQDTISKYNYDDIYNLLKKLKLQKFIKNKKNISLKKISEEGGNISGGQAQRIALARCLYKKSEIIILDEFTSSLDQLTEKHILKTIKEHFKNKIVIIITHKKNLIKFFNKSYEIKNKKFTKI